MGFFTVQYPDGYLESMAAKQESQEDSSEEEGNKKGRKNRKRKNLGKLLHVIGWLLSELPYLLCQLQILVSLHLQSSASSPVTN